MKKTPILFLVFLFFSCTSLEKELHTHLKNGLRTYYNTIPVNLNFIPGISLKKLAIIKKNQDEYFLVLKLNDDIVDEKINKYSLAVKSYLDNEKYKDLLEGKPYVSNPIKPNLRKVGTHKYIITPYNIKANKIEQIEFFLFDRDKFRKVLSKPIFVKNISVK